MNLADGAGSVCNMASAAHHGELLEAGDGEAGAAAEIDAVQAVAPGPAPGRLRQPVERAVAQPCREAQTLMSQAAMGLVDHCPKR